MNSIKILYIWLLRTFTVAVLTQLLAFSAQARDYDESQLLLREAMMESNADYNKHKKKVNDEDNERADDWGERKTQAIVIDGRSRDVSNFQEMKEEVEQDREVSSHKDEQDDNSFDD